MRELGHDDYNDKFLLREYFRYNCAFLNLFVFTIFTLLCLNVELLVTFSR